MTSAALGSFVVALLPSDHAYGLIAVFGGFVALSLAAGIVAVGYMARAGQPAVPTAAAAPAAEGN